MLADNLRIQDRVAQKLKAKRHEHGALDLQTLEARPVFEGDVIKDLRVEAKNRATSLIEDLHDSGQRCNGEFSQGQAGPLIKARWSGSKRWDRIVEIAAQHNYQLPEEPDSKALALFLVLQKQPIR